MKNKRKLKRARFIRILIYLCIIAIGIYIIFDSRKEEIIIYNSSDEEKYLSVDLGNNIFMDFVLIESGKFNMGSYEEVGDEDELPVREISITQPFYMGRYEVTQRQWQQVMGENPSSFIGDDLPVETVSYSDCILFVKKVSEITGLNFSLPTEAMWEYAARAGTESKWFYGNDEKDGISYNWIAPLDNNKTHPVGMKESNPWELYDIYGNVQEWCLDWYENPYSTKSMVNPVGPMSGESKVVRGGGWGAFADNARSAYRNALGPDIKNDGVGLRCVILID